MAPGEQNEQNMQAPQPAHDTDLVGSTLEVDDSFDDRDSALGDDASSVATSLDPDASKYKYEHGRRYHSYRDGQYYLPNDEQEIDRLELQHRIWYITLDGKLGLAPIADSVRSVLDIGCGTGSWAIDFATAHPQAEVIGTDLSPIQPTAVPQNCTFIVDDATSTWAFPHKFDYIHTRCISIGVTNDKWPLLIAEAFANLEPGGFFELQEWSAPFRCDDGSAPPDSAFMKWGADGLGAAAKAGIDVGAAAKLSQKLEEAGFINIKAVETKWPLGPWPKGKREKKIGELFARDMEEALKSSSLRLYTGVLGWTEEELDKWLAVVAKDMRDPKRHTYMPIHVCYGQKPLEPKSTVE